MKKYMDACVIVCSVTRGSFEGQWNGCHAWLGRDGATTAHLFKCLLQKYTPSVKNA
jgi:hypothetical protein